MTLQSSFTTAAGAIRAWFISCQHTSKRREGPQAGEQRLADTATDAVATLSRCHVDTLRRCTTLEHTNECTP